MKTLEHTLRTLVATVNACNELPHSEANQARRRQAYEALVTFARNEGAVISQDPDGDVSAFLMHRKQARAAV